MLLGSALAMLAAMYSATIRAESLSGRATVVDGRTLEIRGERIRLLDMDAPAMQQTCQDATGAGYPCGQRAALALSALIGQRDLSCEWANLDSDGRKLARCIVADEDVGLRLVAAGWAVPGRDCKCETYRDAAARAQAERVGLWAGRFDMPWDWRQAT